MPILCKKKPTEGPPGIEEGLAVSIAGFARAPDECARGYIGAFTVVSVVARRRRACLARRR